MDQLIQETNRNREMLNQIAHRTFTTNAPDQGVSRKYISTSIKIFIFTIFGYFGARVFRREVYYDYCLPRFRN